MALVPVDMTDSSVLSTYMFLIGMSWENFSLLEKNYHNVGIMSEVMQREAVAGVGHSLGDNKRGPQERS